MKIEREAISQLLKWKDSPIRKPLILQGARQVGKTFLLKDFGNRFFENVVYFNFEENRDLQQLFSATKDINRIVDSLSFLSEPIKEKTTLIIFDEIQECNDALNSLKYFAESDKDYFVACAGSLLGVAMNRGYSFPVGKVDFITIYPLSFREFLKACSERLYSFLADYNKIEPLLDIFFNPLIEQYKMYSICGGMPEAVKILLSEKDVNKTSDILNKIIHAYSLDFSKYSDNKDIFKISYVFNSIPSQLAKENKKFIYQTVRSGARAREYERAVSWLEKAGLTYLVYRTTKPSLPMSAYDDLSAFKIYLSDVGLLREMASIEPRVILNGNSLFTEFKGSLAENYVLQSLIKQFSPIPRYWTSGNMAEIDFMIQYEGHIIPIEVKADKNIKSKSLAIYKEKYAPKLLLRYSLKNLELKDNILNIPLFMVDYTKDIIRDLF
jgi:Predicted ATPase (AAA+ superfamily)